MKCRCCGNHLYIEDELNYPLVCYNCDENMFIFEGIDEYDGETKDMYKYIEWIPKVVKKIIKPNWYGEENDY